MTVDVLMPPPPGWHTTAIGLNGKGEGEVDGLTL